ncbi:MAG TPA: serine hydrolase [Microscillaceae bacterium]|nr:serine hydrolase [Microscillaceae bacterium]
MRTKRLLQLILVGCTTICLSAKAQKTTINQEIKLIENGLEPRIQVKGQVKKYNILDRMKHYKVPGVSIAVVKEGKIRWAKGYGIANTATGTKVNVNTLFQAGSISKPVAALAALKLVQEGKVSLDKDVNQYLKGWKVPENKFTKNKKVTLRGLLTHSAGLTVHGFPGYAQNDHFPDIVSVLNGKGNTASVRVDMEPGTRFRYSGGGYTVMEKVVEDVTGMPLEKYMAQHIFKKLDMTNSTYAQPLPKQYHAQASAAYRRDGEIIKGWWHNYPEQAAAGLWTTPTDLAKYCLEIQQIFKGKKGGILSQDMVKQMLQKHKNEWGLGPSLHWSGDSLLFEHGGKNEGFTNEFLAFVHRGAAFIVMTSGDNGGRLIGEIRIALSRCYGWGIQSNTTVALIELDRSQLQAYVGKYKYSGKVRGKDYLVEVRVENGKLVLDNLPRKKISPLDPTSKTKFVDLNNGNRITFKKATKGAGYTLYWNKRYRFDRVK